MELQTKDRYLFFILLRNMSDGDKTGLISILALSFLFIRIALIISETFKITFIGLSSRGNQKSDSDFLRQHKTFHTTLLCFASS